MPRLNSHRLGISVLVVLSVLAVLVVGAAVWKDGQASAAARLAAQNAPPATTSVTASKRTTVVAIGDSYTGGSLMGGTEIAKNWTTAAAAKLQADGVAVQIGRSAASGSGYVATGTKNLVFEQLVPGAVTVGTKVVVVFGSRNDAGKPGVAEHVTATLRAAKAANPAAALLVIGPPWINERVPAALLVARDEVKAAALAAGATFVDPIAEQWFFGADSTFIGSDGVHPTDAGHAYMGAKIAPHLEESVRGLPAA